jgi:hypothetical protein
MPAGRTDKGVDDLERRSWRRTTVEVAHLITVPQGFTVAVAGSVALCVGRHGFPGFLAVWLFVVGASLSYCVVVVAVGATHRPVVQPGGIVGLALLNLSAIVVVPLVALATWWISDPNLAYFATGCVVHLTYVPLVALAITVLSRRPETASGSLGSP